jgi:PAT family beta-lactamase induction signal transducer AmpG
LIGGFVAAKRGLKYWLWPMVFAINVPDIVYVYLSYFKPEDFLTINICVAFEQLGYGFGFTAYSLVMLYVSQGKHSTAHFALCTGFMALGMMIPGMFSGEIQRALGYQGFFVWVVLATLPGFLVTKLIKVDAEFGKRKESVQ